ncbi:MAG: sensor histidine kinase [Dehalococcoidia bacterium]
MKDEDKTREELTTEISDLRQRVTELYWYQLIAEKSYAGIYIFQDGQFQWVNQALADMSGYSRDELVDMDFLSLLHPDYREIVRGATEQALRGDLSGLPSELEIQFLRKDGETRWAKIMPALGMYKGRPAIVGNVVDTTDRKGAEQALEESEAKYRLLSEDLRDVIFVEDMTLTPTYINSAAERLFGYSVQELMHLEKSRYMMTESYNKSLAFFQKYVSVAQSDPTFDEPPLMENEYVRKDGSTFWGELKVRFLRDAAGNLVGSQGILRDITERKQAEQQLRDSLNEKETLLREIHHRVKNNLQIVSSLLRRQGRQTQDETLRQMLKESENRVLSMSLIHEKLYHSENLAAINFREFIRSVSHSLFRSYGAANVALKPDIEDLQLPIHTAIPCGMMVNELVSNALKHAFLEGQRGEIAIALHRIGDSEVELVVRDNGVGMPEDIDIWNTETLGMDLVTMLAEKQLHGKLELDRSQGTEFRIRFLLA